MIWYVVFVDCSIKLLLIWEKANLMEAGACERETGTYEKSFKYSSTEESASKTELVAVVEGLLVK